MARSHLAEGLCECGFGLVKHAQVNVQVHGRMPCPLRLMAAGPAAASLIACGKRGARALSMLRGPGLPAAGGRRHRLLSCRRGGAARRVVGAGAGPAPSPIFLDVHRGGLEDRLFGHGVPVGDGQFVGGGRVFTWAAAVPVAVVERGEDGARPDVADPGRARRSGPRRDSTRTRSPSAMPSRSASAADSSTQASGAACVQRARGAGLGAGVEVVDGAPGGVAAAGSRRRRFLVRREVLGGLEDGPAARGPWPGTRSAPTVAPVIRSWP